MKKKKENIITAFLVLAFFAGLSLLLYPPVSDYWNSFHQTKSIASYAEKVADIDEEKYEELLAAADEYNKKLAKQNAGSCVLTEEQRQEYESLLNVSGGGIMGYIEIPSISCSLPVYHGTEKSVLQVGVGHLDWSSLPVGGKSSHCVLSGHRGLPSAKLFTDLNKLAEGDLFVLRVLDEVLTYEVDRILIVEPQETAPLNIVKGKDYCTLVTCTPYGVNTHRLLVRGHRIENVRESGLIHVTADAVRLDPLLVAPAVAMPVLLILLVIVLLPKGFKKKFSGNLWVPWHKLF